MKIKDFRLERFFAKYEFDTKHLLCSSDSESMSVGELFGLESNQKELTVEFMNLRLGWFRCSFRSIIQMYPGYTESKGAPQLRKEVAKFYSTKVENVLVNSLFS